MKRRGFFATVLGALCAPFLPTPKPGLMFHKDAFKVVFDWPAIEAIQAQGEELFVVSGGQGYIYRSGDVAFSAEDFAKLAQPHLNAARRQLAEAIDRE